MLLDFLYEKKAIYINIRFLREIIKLVVFYIIMAKLNNSFYLKRFI